MSNLNQPNPKGLQALLNIASQKLGTSPEVLQRQLQDGTFEKALSTMPGSEAAKLRQALSNPKTAEKILSTPQAQAIYKKLNQG
ncbi:hypothetical protein [Ruminococcus sp. Marseille-P6503]|uniref:hypothetical protein n=1 Tax=Ruminococcus sp. Marseille-P6503 TaxID=2364796 RepID=UPI000F51D492|nr:hypothetical protein [Ruminococcus sp. Marseille-P6503]